MLTRKENKKIVIKSSIIFILGTIFAMLTYSLLGYAITKIGVVDSILVSIVVFTVIEKFILLPLLYRNVQRVKSGILYEKVLCKLREKNASRDARKEITKKTKLKMEQDDHMKLKYFIPYYQDLSVSSLNFLFNGLFVLSGILVTLCIFFSMVPSSAIITNLFTGSISVSTDVILTALKLILPIYMINFVSRIFIFTTGEIPKLDALSEMYVHSNSIYPQYTTMKFVKPIFTTLLLLPFVRVIAIVALLQTTKEAIYLMQVNRGLR